MRRFTLFLSLLVAFVTTTMAQSIDLTFTKVSATDATVAVAGNDIAVDGVTATITANYDWKALNANSQKFPNASILCPDKNTNAMTAGSGAEGIFTITLNNLPAGYSYKNVTFTSVALNGGGEFQADDANAQPVNFELTAAGEVVGTIENKPIKVNSNGGESVVVNFEVAEAYPATDGSLELKLKLATTESKGCFYGLIKVSIEAVEEEIPALPAFTVTAEAQDPTMGTATVEVVDGVAYFKAVPNEGYKFVDWLFGGEATGQAAEFVIEVSQNIALVAVFEAIAVEPEEPAVKWYRLKETSRNEYMNVVSYDPSYEQSAYGMVNIAPYAESNDQIFTMEDAGDGKVYLRTNNNYYLTCGAWNVNVSPDAKEALIFEETTIDGATAYFIHASSQASKGFKIGGVNLGNGTYSDDYYVYCDAPQNLWAYWVLEEATLVEETPVAPSYTVTVDVNDAAMGTATVEYVDGKATFTATANEGYKFVDWSWDGSLIGQTSTFVVDPVEFDIALVAIFEAIAPAEKEYLEVVSVSPVDKAVVNSLDYIQLNFNEEEKASCVATLKPVVLDKDNNIVATLNYGYQNPQGGWLEYYEVGLIFSEPITTPGTYTVKVPAGAIFNNYTKLESQEIVLTYTVEEPQYLEIKSISPENNSIVEVLDYIELTFDEEVFAIGNAELAVMNVLDKDGNVVTDAAISYYDKYNNELPFHMYSITLSKSITAPGTYTINIPEGAIWDTMEGNIPATTLTYTIEGEPEPEPEPEPVTEYAYYEGTNNHAARALTSFTIANLDTEASLVVEDIQVVGAKSPIFVDKTDKVLEVQPGNTIYFEAFGFAGEWMHAYAYIDYNNDFIFDTNLNADGTTGGELVSYNHYNDKTSLGTASDSHWANTLSYEGSQGLPYFVLPADLAAGDYRMRIKTDWNHLDPNFVGQTSGNDPRTIGACQVDIILRVAGDEEPGVDTAIDNVNAEGEQVIYDITGRRIEKINAAGIYIVNGVKVLVK